MVSPEHCEARPEGESIGEAAACGGLCCSSPVAGRLGGRVRTACGCLDPRRPANVLTGTQPLDQRVPGAAAERMHTVTRDFPVMPSLA